MAVVQSLSSWSGRVFASGEFSTPEDFRHAESCLLTWGDLRSACATLVQLVGFFACLATLCLGGSYLLGHLGAPESVLLVVRMLSLALAGVGTVFLLVLGMTVATPALSRLFLVARAVGVHPSSWPTWSLGVSSLSSRAQKFTFGDLPEPAQEVANVLAEDFQGTLGDLRLAARSLGGP